MNGFVDFAVNDDCINHNSYGEICIHCNCCGRIDKNTQKEAQIKYYKECLEENENFNEWFDAPELKRTQKRNVNKSIKYYKAKLKELGEEIK